MKAAIVLDASATLSMIFRDEAEGASDALAFMDSADAIVPPIWPAEVTNALYLGIRRGRIDHEGASAALGYLRGLPLTVTELRLSEYAEEIVPLALRHTLSVYDASYLHLAQSRGLPLLTRDRRLQAAAQAEGVGLA